MGKRGGFFSNMHRSAQAPRTGYAPSRSASSGQTTPSCSVARGPYHPSRRNGQKGERGGHPLCNACLRQQGGGVYLREVGGSGAGRACGHFPFGSGHLPPKPGALACSGHFPCGKENAPFFYFTWSGLKYIKNV